MRWRDRTFGFEIELNLDWGLKDWNRYLDSTVLDHELCGYIDATHQHGVIPDYDIHVTYDGSVRAHDGEYGWEMLTRPATFKEKKFLDNLTILLLDLYKNGAMSDSSCGFHIHIGAGDFKLKDLSNILWFYTVWQEVLYSFLPRERRGNYSYPFSNTSRNWFKSELPRCESIDEAMYRVWYDIKNDGGARYHHFNLVPFGRGGHYEIRSCMGLINPQRMFNWTALHLRIADYITQLDELDMSEPEQTTAEELFRTVKLPINLIEYYMSEQRRWQT